MKSIIMAAEDILSSQYDPKKFNGLAYQIKEFVKSEKNIDNKTADLLVGAIYKCRRAGQRCSSKAKDDAINYLKTLVNI